MNAVALPKISPDAKVQARYEELRGQGTSHNLAEILATGMFPGTKTDREFWHGRWDSGGGLHPAEYMHHKQIAEEAGVSVTGKFYCRGLADFPGDPTAWVSDRGDVLRVAREKQMKVSGLVEYNPGDRDPMPDAPLAEDIVEAIVEDRLAENPDANVHELRAQVIEHHTGQVDNNPLLVDDIPPDAIGPDL